MLWTRRSVINYSRIIREAMVLMRKPSVIKFPSGRTPEKAPRWDLTGTKGCDSGKVFSWMPLVVLGYKSIYRRKKYVGGATRGPRGWGARPTPLCAPSVLVAASWLLRLHLQVSWLSSGPRKIIAKVLFRLDSVWYSFSVEL